MYVFREQVKVVEYGYPQRKGSTVKETGTTAVDPTDDLMHSPDMSEPRWRESYYFQFYDFNLGIGGYCGPGYRPSKGYSGAVVVLWGLDMPTLVSSEYDRYEIHDKVHPVGDLTFEIVEPLKEWVIRFDGKLNDAGMGKVIDPHSVGQAGRDGHKTKRVQYELRFTRDKPAYLYRKDPRFYGLFDAHIDEVGSVEGWLSIEDEEFRISGRGCKDHSWGARDWSLPLGWRWVDLLDEVGPEMTLWRATFDGQEWVHDGAIYWSDSVTPITLFGERTTWGHRKDADYPDEWEFVCRGTGTELRGKAETLRVVPLRFKIVDENGNPAMMWNDRVTFRLAREDGGIAIGTAEFQFRLPAESGPNVRALLAAQEPDDL